MEPGQSAAREPPRRPVRAAAAGDDRARVGSHRDPGIRWAARAHRDAARAGPGSLRGTPGALVGGGMFILPGLLMILGLAALFLGSPPDWVRGAGAGAGAAVAAVAIHAGLLLLRPAWGRAAPEIRWRFVAYVLLGTVSAATLGPWLVAVLVACGVVEVGWGKLAGGAPSVSPLPAI